MKKLVCFLSIAVIMLVSVVTAFAHGGRTDSKGGHYNRDTGEYHYHHGYSAHQHDGGTCPYDFDDAEENDYVVEEYDSHSKSNYNHFDNEWLETIFWVIVAIAFIVFAMICLFWELIK